MKRQRWKWNKDHEVKMQKNRASSRYELKFMVPF